MISFAPRRLLASAIVSALAAITPAHAETWTGAIDNSWIEPNNWSPNTVPGSGATAVFNGPGNGNTSITLGGATQQINTVQFDPGAAAYTIGQTSNDVLSFDSNGLLEIKLGVTTAQTFNATVNVTDVLAINSVPNGVATGNGLVGLTFGPLNIGGTFTVTQGDANVTTLLGGTISDAPSQTGSLVLAAPTSGASNNSNFILSGNNTYSGGTTIQANTGTSGGVYVGTDSAFGTGKINIVDTGANPEMRALGGTRTISNTIELNRGVVFSGTDSVVLNGPIKVASGASRTIFSKIPASSALYLGATPGSSTIYLGNPDTGFASTINVAASLLTGLPTVAGNVVVNAVFQDVNPSDPTSSVTYSGNAPGKIIINTPQTYTSPTRTGAGQVTLQFHHDYNAGDPSGPFGLGTFHANGANNAQLVPTGGNRTIANPILMDFGITVDNLKDSGGATLDNSGVTFTGPITFTSTASRLIQNKMNRTAGGTLTLGSASNPSTFSLVLGPSGTTRNLSFDNQGRTVVNDTIQDVPDPNNPANATPVNLVINSSTSITTFNGDQTTNGNFTVNGSTTANPIAIINGTRSGSGTVTTSGTLVVNGAKTGNGAVTVNSTGTLAGTGSIAGHVTNNGEIIPGSETLTPGTITLTGNLTDGANSRWLIGLNGTSSGKLAIGGNLDLTAVDNLDVIGTGSGSSWLIATYGGTLMGMFDNVTPGYSVDYGTIGQIILNVAGLPGDHNNDGRVDAADYVVWRKDPANNGGDPGGYDTWVQNFGNPPGGGSGAFNAGGAVPEPTTMLLLLLATAGLSAAHSRWRAAT